ncbi:unnamed protein product [Camellia sinensis]
MGERIVQEFERQNEKMKMVTEVMGDAIDDALEGDEEEEEETAELVNQLLNAPSSVVAASVAKNKLVAQAEATGNDNTGIDSDLQASGGQTLWVKSLPERTNCEVITQLKEPGLHIELYYRNKEMGETYSIVPTSAISGEGIPDLLLLLVQWTQKTIIEKLMYRNEVQCSVLFVKVIEGHGATLDVVLVNGVLQEGDQIVVCGMQTYCYLNSSITDTPSNEGTLSKVHCSMCGGA